MLSAANSSRSRVPRVPRIEPAPLSPRQQHEALKLCQPRSGALRPSRRHPGASARRSRARCSMIRRILLSFAILLLASPAGAALLPDARPAAELLTQAPDSLTMPRKPTGNVYDKAGRWFARVSLGPKLRPSIALPSCTTEAEALARLPLLSELAAKLRTAGHEESARAILERAAASEGKALAGVVRIVDALCKGDLAPMRREVVNATTIKAIGGRRASSRASTPITSARRRAPTTTRSASRCTSTPSWARSRSATSRSTTRKR